ncbi:putative bifunctional diguanylate cyclase/phosphodiesterase [Catellatospora tritici]|uniref:putative bifunctional diguanylate cyclase/phosphodiesterase n=1 Tax=Catellatospora tritici TaxID=2851566 RepID=UPI001C2DDA96|nr:bifunctional diguanylate cyclase/phosphodiesterase [Catellatospora tritici]MBV1849590.1 bifunctional diguanylate cyclase/phosphodiesterase [Catellatospora tritici]
MSTSLSRTWDRWQRWSGVATAARPVRLLTAALAVCAAAVAVAGLLLDGGGRLADFGLLVGLVVLAHLFGMRMRVGSTYIDVDWGEAALIVGFTLVPGGWLPAATGLAVLVAKPVLALFTGNRTTAFEVLRASASLTLSAGLAVLVVSVSGVQTRPMTPSSVAVVVLAAVLYLLCSALLLALHLGVRDGQSMVGVVWQALRGTPVMIVGNVALGLLAVGLWRSSWLWVLPPLLWLVHQLYVHRLREDEERRTWGAFAAASRSLHKLDEVAVAQEGLRAAQSLFPVRAVELTVLASHTRYHGATRGGVFELAGAERADIPPAESDRLPVVTRLLEVAGGPVGLLTLRLSRQSAWGLNDQHRLAAFGDALAAALHDAATHSALRELRERNTYDSHHDPLTRLLNRDALLERGDAVLRGLDARAPVALLLLDMDHFKEVNDTLGHLAGDELLQTAATRLVADADESELVARLGGDEFALLITDLPAMSWDRDAAEPDLLGAAKTVAERRARALAAALASPTEVAGVTLSSEVSVGVVVAAAGEFDPTELLRRADIALYQAKESGARVTAYDPARDRTSTDRLALVAELRTALAADDQLHLVLQPAVDLHTGKPTGVEALIRWHHPRRGLLTPVHFVRAVEASDLLGRFTRHVLDQALGFAAQWGALGMELPVAVNLSPRSLLDPRLPADVAELLKKHRLPASRLVLEITETVVLSPLPVTDQVLQELRKLGVRFAVDDFGTGFSSLTFLTRIAVDELKIDRTFVARMGESKQAAAIVRAVVDLGRQLGIRVVAEGVETGTQRAALSRLGCDAAQGFHFSRPLPGDQIIEALRTLASAARPARKLRAEPGGLASG